MFYVNSPIVKYLDFSCVLGDCYLMIIGIQNWNHMYAYWDQIFKIAYCYLMLMKSDIWNHIYGYRNSKLESHICMWY